MPTIPELIERLENAEHVELLRAVKPWRAATLRTEPHFGEITWTPPASYRAALAAGLVSANRPLPSLDVTRGFELLGPDQFTGKNADLVHLPEGVSRERGVVLSTNHLVGFATAANEAVWCFDVSAPGADGEYPIYYHHQDEPRARVLATGEWDAPTQPDFESFTQWLETMTAGLVAQDAPRWFEDLGRPGLTFAQRRIALETPPAAVTPPSAPVQPVVKLVVAMKPAVTEAVAKKAVAKKVVAKKAVAKKAVAKKAVAKKVVAKKAVAKKVVAKKVVAKKVVAKKVVAKKVVAKKVVAKKAVAKKAVAKKASRK